jgi:hypothetical protein
MIGSGVETVMRFCGFFCLVAFERKTIFINPQSSIAIHAV